MPLVDRGELCTLIRKAIDDSKPKESPAPGKYWTFKIVSDFDGGWVQEDNDIWNNVFKNSGD